MRKLHIFLIILFIVIPITLLGIYVAFEPSRPMLEGFFVPLGQSAYSGFTTASAAFMAIPYWQYLGAGIVLVIGYLLGHYNQVWWVRLKGWGFKETMKPLQGLPPLQKAPVNPLPQQIYPNPDIQQTQTQLEETQQQ